MTDWATHFQRLSAETSRAARQAYREQADFGTVGGLYTVAELRDLIAAKNKEVEVLTADGNKFLPTWRETDPMAADAWANDLATLIRDYDAAIAIANKTITEGRLLPENMSPADSEYRGVLTAVNNLWQQKTDGPGSLGDLRSRLQAAGAVMTAYAVDQPKKGSDFDTSVYRETEPIVTLPGEAGGFDILGLKKAGKKTVKEIENQKWWIAGGVLAGLVGLVAVAKIVK